MSNVRAVVLVILVAPGLSMLLLLPGRLELAGVLTGLAAGFLLCGEAARAALATLCGSVSAVLIGQIFAETPDALDFADQMAGWPGWPVGAVLAYLIAARGLPPKTAGRPAVLPVGLAALTAAALGCGQLIAAKALEMTLWEDYHPFDGPAWYRDLTSATWYPAAAVVIATAAAAALPGGRGRFLALPLAAWLGCAVTAGPLQYAQALGVTDKSPTVALLASLAGGGIGAAASAAGLRHGGTRLGLVSYVLAVTVALVTSNRLEVRIQWDQFIPAVLVSMVLVSVVAARAAYQNTSVGSGVVAGMAGPLLIWSVYLTVGPRLYDHSSQAVPYWLAWVTVPAALITALAAAVAGTRSTCRR
ncbi:hypothetical protein Aple_029910 [Acrocarpospora pleiomorpha]|uniref:Uncharacterized protein n=1 Tax=Acrocarpospora pleiomorpha TaxID=90975 RepID=A0A5M3XEQ9_9ACTN|nr:hypothetical protein [Acrocarpospora pleiomorpha]GES20095.1 hypothetical protein Aple_029910 [Acrocarpospora pleiomorpha]